MSSAGGGRRNAHSFPLRTKVADALKGKEDLLSDEILIQLGGSVATTQSAPTYNTLSEGMCPVRK
ncbi:hypothetical protein [Streptomyces sp. NPDC057636]|uniref:hypothetical protein n=1 Tax=Streptomyces sp. NPDC057636 TaxID=3346189 RepID=UPI0036C181D6